MSGLEKLGWRVTGGLGVVFVLGCVLLPKLAFAAALLGIGVLAGTLIVRRREQFRQHLAGVRASHEAYRRAHHDALALKSRGRLAA
jgi:hypothetical protein